MKSTTTLEEMTRKISDIIRIRESGDMDEETFRDTLESILEGEVEDKLEAYAAVIDDLDDDITAIDNRIEKLKKRKESIQRDKDWMKSRVIHLMTTAEIASLKTPFHTFTRKLSSTRQVVVDMGVNDLPEWALRTKVEVNKSAIADYLKENGTCDFAHFDELKETLVIK